MENVRGAGCGGCGLFPLVGDTQLLPVLWVNYIYPLFSSATFHNKTIVCLIANQNMEDVRHTDVLMNVLFGDLHPYDPGCSCGVTLCIGSQTHRETEDPYRCQPFNLFCKQFIIEIKLGLLLVGAEGRGKKAQIRGNVTKDLKLIFLTYD